MRFREAEKRDLPAIKNFLELAGLPGDDCENLADGFVILEEKGEIVATGCLEICGRFGLLRSIAVTPVYRGKGFARQMVALLEKQAYTKKIRRLYLLTETATDYFMKLGFSVMARSETPDSIARTRQFRELCPLSAKVMYRNIAANSEMTEGL